VFARFSPAATKESGESEDARVKVYSALIKAFPEYCLTGVGAGNYYRSWASTHGVRNKAGFPLGTHNSVLQVLVYWGIAGVTIYIAMLWLAYRSLPPIPAANATTLALFGITVAMGIRLLFAHQIYIKEFASSLDC